MVAREGNGGADQIRSTGCGIVYDDQEHSGLAAALTSVRKGGDSLRERARSTWQDRFSVKRWLTATIRVYEEAGMKRD